MDNRKRRPVGLVPEPVATGQMAVDLVIRRLVLSVHLEYRNMKGD